MFFKGWPLELFHQNCLRYSWNISFVANLGISPANLSQKVFVEKIFEQIELGFIELRDKVGTKETAANKQ